MSVERFYRDLILLGAMVSLIFISILVLYYYFTTFDERFLVLGLVFIGLILLGAIFRYRFVVDYVGTLLKKWR
jgi:hypothetical protein